MSHEDVVINGIVTCEYDSLAEFADGALRRKTGLASDPPGKDGSTWYGAPFDEAIELAGHGWTDQLADALALAESAIETADQDHMMDTFNPVWDVTGAEVDVARYLSGEPECMIDFPLARTSKQGRVITLVASNSISSAVNAATIIKRGQLITALALALGRLGHATELWFSNHTSAGRTEAEVRVKVKGVDDELDPAQIMFAYAHPASLRRLTFAVKEGFKGAYRDDGTMGSPMPPTTHGFPEGTIFLPELRSRDDVPDADQFLRQYLGELGLLAE